MAGGNGGGSDEDEMVALEEESWSCKTYRRNRSRAWLETMPSETISDVVSAAAASSSSAVSEVVREVWSSAANRSWELSLNRALSRAKLGGTLDLEASEDETLSVCSEPICLEGAGLPVAFIDGV